MIKFKLYSESFFKGRLLWRLCHHAQHCRLSFFFWCMNSQLGFEDVSNYSTGHNHRGLPGPIAALRLMPRYKLVDITSIEVCWLKYIALANHPRFVFFPSVHDQVGREQLFCLPWLITALGFMQVYELVEISSFHQVCRRKCTVQANC